MASQEAYIAMSISSKINWIAALVIVHALLFFSKEVRAEPYLAYKNNFACSNCHVNPDGGSLRNQAGQAYGQSVLAAKSSQLDTSSFLRVADYLQLGGDMRFNANFEQNDTDQETQSFEIHSAQIYAAVSLPGEKLSLILDQTVAPGVSINREAYLLYKMGDDQYLKMGKMFLPFGIRLEDDSAFVRQVTGTNFDNSDNGIAYGKSFGRTELDIFVTNGTSQVSNDDEHFLYGARVEHRFDDFRLGAGLIYNDKDAETIIYNAYAATSLGRFTFLAEADWIELNSMSAGGTIEQAQLAALFEVNYQWQRGLNLKATTEYFDPDQDTDEDQQTRHSVVMEYTPISHLQFRLGFRQQDDIPQQPENNKEIMFLQTHLYF
mgnify:CR=1 FL=1